MSISCLRISFSAAVKSGGNLGKVSQKLADIVDPHFKLEEKWAFPPLSLMLPLSQGEITPDMRNSQELIGRLRRELPRLSEDHHTIIHMLEDFDDAVRNEGKAEFSQFSYNLTHHAHAEEGILFPAAILIGEYLRLKL